MLVQLVRARTLTKAVQIIMCFFIVVVIYKVLCIIAIKKVRSSPSALQVYHNLPFPTDTVPYKARMPQRGRIQVKH